MIAGLIFAAFLGIANAQFLSGKAWPPAITESFDIDIDELNITCFTNGAAVTYLAIDRVDFVGATNLAEWSSGPGSSASVPYVTASDFGSPLEGLTALIADPNCTDAVTYICRGIILGGVLRSFHIRVPYNKPPFREIMDRIEDNEEDIANLTARLDGLRPYEPQLNFTDDIIALRDEQERLETVLNDTIDRLDIAELDIDELGCELNNTNDFVAALDTALFATSDSLNGSVYILSEYTPTSFLSAEDFCIARGGSLAQVDNAAEFDFIADFLYARLGYQQRALIGATRIGTEFVNSPSGTPTYTDFFVGGNDGAGVGENCLAFGFNLFGQPGVKMDDVQCDFLPWFPTYGWVHGFLCEVDENFGEDCS